MSKRTQSSIGSGSGPRRAPSSPTATAGPTHHCRNHEQRGRDPAAARRPAPALTAAAAAKPSTTGMGRTGIGAGRGSPGGLTSAPPAGGDKKVIAAKALGTVKWFNVKNRYGFINRNDTKEHVFVHQTAVKKNPRKYLRGALDGETVEFDVAEGEKGAQTANVTGPGRVPGQGSKCAADRNHHRHYPRRRGPPRNPRRITRTVRVGKRMRDRRVLPKARPDSAGPTAGEGAPLTARGDPVGVDHSIPTLLCREK